MSDLISGKEALKHVAECIVQYQHPNVPKGVWTTITDHFWDQYSLGIFLNEDTKFKFRLKPRTITLNGIEVPVPFKPKKGDRYWYLAQNGIGYSTLVLNFENDSKLGVGCWKSEEEIKQVVAALRSIFNVK